MVNETITYELELRLLHDHNQEQINIIIVIENLEMMDHQNM